MDMKKERIALLKEAISESQRFMKRAKAALNEELQDSGRSIASPSRKFAATKRSSFDLSQALVEPRRNPWDRM